MVETSAPTVAGVRLLSGTSRLSNFTEPLYHSALGITARDKDVLQAQQKANEVIAAIRAVLTENGIAPEDINTGYLNIYAMYDYTEGMEEISAYNANSTLAIRLTDMEIVGQVIDLDFDVLGYLDPGITVNVIKNGELAKREHLSLPERVTDIIRCKNPRCITSSEPDLLQEFRLTDREKKIYRCVFCDSEAPKEI